MPSRKLALALPAYSALRHTGDMRAESGGPDGSMAAGCFALLWQGRIHSGIVCGSLNLALADLQVLTASTSSKDADMSAGHVQVGILAGLEVVLAGSRKEGQAPERWYGKLDAANVQPFLAKARGAGTRLTEQEVDGERHDSTSGCLRSESLSFACYANRGALSNELCQ
ncbi:unnamed protein product [Phytophthora lilii]|uniref:Unnamed protein product n=1 Tax=Phytophthora lilii TaxID=2077276 RepID=A0A9W6WYM2_9STRA|nr:unnamed protein product [Phytophthora lilii]